MRTAVGGIALVLLGAAAGMAMIRLLRGPSILDRAVAVDMLLAVMLSGVATEATLNRHTTTVPVLLVLALVGFLGSVSIVRFSARETAPAPGADGGAAGDTAGDTDGGAGGGAGERGRPG